MLVAIESDHSPFSRQLTESDRLQRITLAVLCRIDWRVKQVKAETNQKAYNLHETESGYTSLHCLPYTTMNVFSVLRVGQ